MGIHTSPKPQSFGVLRGGIEVAEVWRLSDSDKLFRSDEGLDLSRPHAENVADAGNGEPPLRDVGHEVIIAYMKALTLWQPWASLIALGHKKIETRCWKTKYRGELAIHSAANLPPKWLGASRHQPEFRDAIADCFNCRRDIDDRSGIHVDAVIKGLPYGKILCIVELVAIDEINDALREELSGEERIFGNYEDGRYAWHVKLIRKFDDPIPAKGNRLLWNWERD